MEENTPKKAPDSYLKDLVRMYESREEGVYIFDWDNFRLLAANSSAFKLHECHLVNDLENAFCSLPSPFSKKEAHHWLLRAKESGAQRFEWKIKNPGGKIIHYRVLIDKLELSGRPLLLAMTDSTVDELLTAEEELLSAVQISQNTSEFSSMLFSQLGDQKSFFRVLKAECQRVGELFLADHVYFNIIGEDNTSSYFSIQWPDDKCVLGEMFFFDENTSYIWKQLQLAIPFCFESPELLPYEATAEKDFFLESGIKSAGYVPVIFNNKFRAVLAIEFTSRNHLWKQIEIADLRILGNILSAAFSALETDIEIRRNELKYESIIESMSEGVIVYSPELEIVMCNTSAAAILRTTVEGLKKTNWKDWENRLIHPEGKHLTLEEHPAHLTVLTGKPYVNVKIGILGHDGLPYCWVAMNSSPLIDDTTGKSTGAVLTFTNATQEIEAIKKQRTLDSFVQHINSGVLITKADSNHPTILYANQTMADLTGYTVNELIGQTPKIFQGPKTDLENLKKIREALDKNQSIRTQVINYTKEGFEYWTDIDIFPIPGINGKPEQFAAIQRDITKEIRTREELAQANELLHLTIEGAHVGTWVYDIQTGKTSYNPEWAKMLGMPPDKVLPDVATWISRIHPEDRDRISGIQDEYLTGKREHQEFEHRLRHEDGHWVWVLSRGRIIKYSPTGTPLVLAGTHLDITEIKESERKIRQSEEQLSLATEAARIGIWDWNISTDECYFSGQLKALIGHSEGEFPHSMEYFYEQIHPADRLVLAQHLEENFAKKKPFRVEVRIKDKKGEYEWFVLRGEAQRDPHGIPVRMIGTCINISQRKKAEDILAREAQLTSLRYQINPHFLFNTLNSIRAFIPNDNKEARSMISNLSEYLRYSLRDGNQPFVKLKQEITALTKYLEIEKIRFSDDLSVEMNIQPETLDYPIAPLLVQPLVENAVKYGKKTNPNQLTVKIFAWMEGEFLNIEVSNTGKWVDSSETIESTHIGISNISDRLIFLYGDDANINIYEEGGQVRVIMKIPVSKNIPLVHNDPHPK
ncbi:MAG: PAS domain-containing protein [Verrucomicrobiota bacterium]|nr:PAS domain-containing protein [Verrucomicrobiota bacterium]